MKYSECSLEYLISFALSEIWIYEQKSAVQFCPQNSPMRFVCLSFVKVGKYFQFPFCVLNTRLACIYKKNRYERLNKKGTVLRTSLPVVRVYTFAGHKLADQGGFPNASCTKYRHRVRRDIFRRRGMLLLAILIRRCQRIRSWSSSSERVAPVNDPCNVEKERSVVEHCRRLSTRLACTFFLI